MHACCSFDFTPLFLSTLPTSLSCSVCSNEERESQPNAPTVNQGPLFKQDSFNSNALTICCACPCPTTSAQLLSLLVMLMHLTLQNGTNCLQPNDTNTFLMTVILSHYWLNGPNACWNKHTNVNMNTIFGYNPKPALLREQESELIQWISKTSPLQFCCLMLLTPLTNFLFLLRICSSPPPPPQQKPTKCTSSS